MALRGVLVPSQLRTRQKPFAAPWRASELNERGSIQTRTVRETLFQNIFPGEWYAQRKVSYQQLLVPL